MRPILIICSIPIFTRNLIWAAGLAGCPCWVMSPQALGMWRWRSHVRGVAKIAESALTNSDPDFENYVATFCRSHDIGIVVAGDTRSSRFLLRIRRQLPAGLRCFPMPKPELFERLYDKGSFAMLLEELGLPHPPTAIVRDIQDVDHLGDFSAPVIVKPAQGEGSCGIETALTTADLRKIVTEAQDLQRHPLVIQRFVEGEDIDLSMLVQGGRCIAWTIQRRNRRGNLEFVDHPQVLALGQKLVACVGYHGVIHFDMRIDQRDGSVMFIEANPRFWGSFNYSLWTGVNFLELGLGMLLGHKVATDFVPPIVECPYLAITKRSLPRLLLGGWPVPRHLNDAQRRAWQYHHRWLGHIVLRRTANNPTPLILEQ